MPWCFSPDDAGRSFASGLLDICIRQAGCSNLGAVLRDPEDIIQPALTVTDCLSFPVF